MEQIKVFRNEMKIKTNSAYIELNELIKENQKYDYLDKSMNDGNLKNINLTKLNLNENSKIGNNEKMNNRLIDSLDYDYSGKEDLSSMRNYVEKSNI